VAVSGDGASAAGGSGCIGGSFIALKQRVLFDLALDIGGELDIGELQQLDRLLQLRGHDKGLALPDIEPLGESHDTSATLLLEEGHERCKLRTNSLIFR
jgi:hypothetical protein